MEVYRHISDIPQTGRPLLLAMGCFDGVHIGHQSVISTAVEQAKERGGEAWVFTFSPHPAKLFCPDNAPPLISAEPCRLRQIEALGVEGVIETPFTREFAALSPETFLESLCSDAPNLSGVVCGEDWSFGYKAAGNIQTLAAFGEKHNFTATPVKPVMDGDRKISSTTIRKAVAEGNIPRAEELLGRPFSLFGTVIPGKKIGRKLGYPTANIDPLNELIPGNGVYSARTRFKGALIDSAVFIGSRETFGCDQHVIEVHLLDFEEDLYEKDLEVCLVEKIRDVGPFPSTEALIQQIEIDIAQIQERLAAD
jgi:riboflavin kinase/FMN adenylyltransferase